MKTVKATLNERQTKMFEQVKKNLGVDRNCNVVKLLILREFERIEG